MKEEIEACVQIGFEELQQGKFGTAYTDMVSDIVGRLYRGNSTVQDFDWSVLEGGCSSGRVLSVDISQHVYNCCPFTEKLTHISEIDKKQESCARNYKEALEKSACFSCEFQNYCRIQCSHLKEKKKEDLLS